MKVWILIFISEIDQCPKHLHSWLKWFSQDWLSGCFSFFSSTYAYESRLILHECSIALLLCFFHLSSSGQHLSAVLLFTRSWLAFISIKLMQGQWGWSNNGWDFITSGYTLSIIYTMHYTISIIGCYCGWPLKKRRCVLFPQLCWHAVQPLMSEIKPKVIQT